MATKLIRSTEYDYKYLNEIKMNFCDHNKIYNLFPLELEKKVETLLRHVSWECKRRPSPVSLVIGSVTDFSHLTLQKIAI